MDRNVPRCVGMVQNLQEAEPFIFIWGQTNPWRCKSGNMDLSGGLLMMMTSYSVCLLQKSSCDIHGMLTDVGTYSNPACAQLK